MHRGPRRVPPVLADTDRSTLSGWARRHETGQTFATRARVVLACAENLGWSNTDVARRLGVGRETVRR